jgi:hypothetical protein
MIFLPSMRLLERAYTQMIAILQQGGSLGYPARLPHGKRRPREVDSVLVWR